MKEYSVILTLDIIEFVKARDEDEAVELVNEQLWNNHSIIMDNLGYEVEEA